MQLQFVLFYAPQAWSDVLVDYDCRGHHNRTLWDLLADSISEVSRSILDFSPDLVERTRSLAQDALNPILHGSCMLGELAAQIVLCIFVASMVASGMQLQAHCRFKFIHGSLSIDDMLPLVSESAELAQQSCCSNWDCSGFRVVDGTYINLGSHECPSSSLNALKTKLNSLDMQVLLASRFHIMALLDTWSAFWLHDLPLGLEGEQPAGMSERQMSQHDTFVNRFSWLVGAFYKALRNEQRLSNMSNALRDASFFAISPIGTFPDNSDFWKSVGSAWPFARAKVADFRLAYVALRCAFSTYSEPSVTPFGGRPEDLLLVQDIFRHATLRELLRGAYSGLTALRIFSSLKERYFEFINSDLLKPAYAWTSSKGAPVVYVTVVDTRWARFLQTWISHTLERTAASYSVIVAVVLGGEVETSCGIPSLWFEMSNDEFLKYVQSFANLAKQGGLGWSCLKVDLGWGPLIAKFVVLSRLLHFGVTAVWIDFDTVVLHDPGPWLESSTSTFDLALPCSSNWLGDLHDALLVARPAAANFVSRIALWLVRNPMLASRPDQFIMACLQHTTSYRPGEATSPHRAWHFIVPMADKLMDPPLYTILDGASLYASAVGWTGDVEQVNLFHLGGMNFTSKQLLFESFFMSGRPSLDRMMTALLRYRRHPAHVRRIGSTLGNASHSEVPGRHELWLNHVTYVENCCKNSLLVNIASGTLAGVNASRWYSRKNLSEDFERTHGHLLDETGSIGAGYWSWKPQVMLQAMDDPTIPEYRGVIVWLDAGNRFVGSLDDIIAEVLSVSDVTSHVNLFAVEWMFSKPDALELLPEGTQPFIRNTPQVGAPFVVARKTPLARRFLVEWLDLMADRRIVSAPGDGYNVLYLEKLWKLTGIVHRPQDTRLGSTLESLEYQYFHLHDQVVYSTLFKRYGFKPLTSAQQANVIALDRNLS